MIYKMKVKDDIEFYKDAFYFENNVIIINTKNITTIHKFSDSGTNDAPILGIALNDIYYPLCEIFSSFEEDFERFDEDCKIAEKYIDKIFNEIVSIMEQEANSEVDNAELWILLQRGVSMHSGHVGLFGTKGYPGAAGQKNTYAS